jgi:hypothetical protein
MPIDSRPNQRATLVGTHAADFPSGSAVYGTAQTGRAYKSNNPHCITQKALAHRRRLRLWHASEKVIVLPAHIIGAFLELFVNLGYTAAFGVRLDKSQV